MEIEVAKWKGGSPAHGDSWAARRASLVLVLVALTSIGCAFKIVPLTPLDAPPLAETPFEETIGVARLRVGPGFDSQRTSWQDALIDHLQAERAFENVVPVEEDSRSERFVLRGEVDGGFRPGGFANFFTWFPGPLLLAHSWRGTRFTYDAKADLELVDTRTQEVVGRYHVETSHRMIHRSFNPGPILGAALVIPGVVKAALSARPSANYRKRVNDRVAVDLWTEVIREIAADRFAYYREQRADRDARCGELNQQPVIGADWTTFTSCQTRRFVESENQHNAGVEPVAIHVSTDGDLTIHVSSGRIVGWSERGVGGGKR